MTYVGKANLSDPRALGIATSKDGYTWSKYAGNPVLRPGAPGQWDDNEVGGTALVYVNNKFHLWYAGFSSSIQRYQIGYATSTPTSAGVNESPSYLPSGYKLYQNYPNPFNPDSRVEYDIPKESQVIVKVFNELGQEITTLVNERQPAGHYSVLMHTRNLSSGVYWCQMHADNYSQTIKLIVMK